MPLMAATADRANRPAVLAAEAAYLLGGATWALADRRSFQAVTGRKRDYWLVQTVAGLLGLIGAVLGLAWLRRRNTSEVRLLGAGTAATLAASDVIFVAQGRIAPIYLADAAANGLLLAAWARAERSGASGT